MRFLSLLLLLSLVASSNSFADSKDPSDYPLRIHVFNREQTTFYHNRMTDDAKGDGRANLFENGEPKGVDFSYECSEKVRPSFGYETYPAKWKKPGQELTVLMPVFGKAGKYFTCNFKTDVKDFAYLTHNGQMRSEPVSDFKTWMQKHDYDPEHGKNQPTNLKQDATPAESPKK